MTCKEFTQVATLYLEGRLSDTERLRVVHHQTQCLGCYDSFQQIVYTVHTRFTF